MAIPNGEHPVEASKPIREARRKLELELYKLIKAFEEENGVSVTRVDPVRNYPLGVANGRLEMVSVTAEVWR